MIVFITSLEKNAFVPGRGSRLIVSTGHTDAAAFLCWSHRLIVRSFSFWMRCDLNVDVKIDRLKPWNLQNILMWLKFCTRRWKNVWPLYNERPRSWKILYNNNNLLWLWIICPCLCPKSLEKPLSVSARISVSLLGDVTGGRNVMQTAAIKKLSWAELEWQQKSAATSAAGSLEISLKMNEKRCAFTTASDLLWNQPVFSPSLAQSPFLRLLLHCILASRHPRQIWDLLMVLHQDVSPLSSFCLIK